MIYGFFITLIFIVIGLVTGFIGVRGLFGLTEIKNAHRVLILMGFPLMIFSKWLNGVIVFFVDYDVSFLISFSISFFLTFVYVVFVIKIKRSPPSGMN